jgi:hypothetical protein
MMKLFTLVAAAGLALVGASPAPMPGHDGAPGAGPAYPFCSRTVHDRCIQRNDRESTAILSADDPAYGNGPPLPEAGPPPPPPEAVAQRDYPPCSASVTDSCMQGGHVRRAPAIARVFRYARHVRRAGERG